MPSPPQTLVLVGAGLSAASGVPTFRDENGLWEGHHIAHVATPQAWQHDAAFVRRFYDERRVAAADVEPNPGHRALVDLQRDADRGEVVLVSQNIDGLLAAAGAREVLDMHGSLWRLRCERTEAHATVPVTGPQDPQATCAMCGARMRPDVVWFEEMPRYLDRIQAALSQVQRFVAVGTSGQVYPAADFGRIAHHFGAQTIEVNPKPSGAPWFDTVVAEGSETALPRLIREWAVT